MSTISKYSRAYGTNRFAVAELDKEQARKKKGLEEKKLKLKKLPDTTLITQKGPVMKSAFGVEHGISKGFNAVAPKLERAMAAAAPGSREHAYAASRLHAGRKGAQVNESLHRASTPLVAGSKNRPANIKIRTNNRVHAGRAKTAQKAGYTAKLASADRTTGARGSLRQMETDSAARIAANPAPAATRMGWKKPAAFAGAGVAGGGGYAYSQNRKRAS